jgi:hypothetical protein
MTSHYEEFDSYTCKKWKANCHNANYDLKRGKQVFRPDFFCQPSARQLSDDVAPKEGAGNKRLEYEKQNCIQRILLFKVVVE